MAQNILVLSDGVPGHDRSSLGIVAALKKHRAVNARVLAVREKPALSRRLRRLLAIAMPFRLFWRAFYEEAPVPEGADALARVRQLPESGVDLVISTGPRTAAANIAVARHLKARNVYFGFGKWPTTKGYTLLLTPEQGTTGGNRAYTLRPSEIDADLLPGPHPLRPDPAGRQAALLIGGQTKHYDYTADDFECLATRLTELAVGLPWLRWTVFDSRRTPAVPFRRFTEIVAASGAPIEIVRYAEGGLLSNDAAFRSDVVLVTADSMSMICESVAARRPTGVLFADAYRPPAHDALEIEALMRLRRIFPLGMSEFDAATLTSRAGHLDLLQASQLDLLYATLEKHGI